MYTPSDINSLALPIILIPLLPLIGYLIQALSGTLTGKMGGWISSVTVLGSFICSLLLFSQIHADQPFYLELFNWFSIGSTPISFAFLVDPLTLIMLLIVTGIGFLIHVYSIGYMAHDEGYNRFFSYLNLFVFFMLLLVMGSNYLVMFIGWEGVGLCSYLLIGFWFKTPAYNDAAKKAFIMNRIGDLGFLLGIFLLLFHFGTIDFAEVGDIAKGMTYGNSIIVAITLLLFIGATGKSAQLPLYTWLPDAMAGPTPVSALIHAATMVTAGIYMVCRSNILFSMAPLTMNVMLVVGVATALFAAIIGLKQNDIKKVLAYSTVSQLGFMFAALGLGAYESGMFHVMTHAFFKALLFLGAGSVIHAMSSEQDIRFMGGLSKYTKTTFITFLIGALAISGIFPLAGFFSKDEILLKAFEANPIVWVILSFSSILTAFYMSRLVFLTFFGSFRGTEEQKHHLHESPATMTIPLIVLAALSIVGGWIGLPEVMSEKHVFANFLLPVFSTSHEILHLHEKAGASTEILLMVIAFSLAVLSIGVAYNVYIKKKELPLAAEELTGLNKWIANKFYVDELYNTIVVRPIQVSSDLLLVVVDKLFIDLIVNATAWIVSTVGRVARLMQTGHLGFYVFAMVLGMVFFMIYQIIL